MANFFTSPPIQSQLIQDNIYLFCIGFPPTLTGRQCHFTSLADCLFVFIVQLTTPTPIGHVPGTSTILKFRCLHLYRCPLVKRARLHIAFKLLKVLYLSPDTCRSRYLGLCTLLCALCRPSVMLCILAYMACERGYTHILTSWPWRSQYSAAPSLRQVNMTFGATMKTATLYDFGTCMIIYVEFYWPITYCKY